MEVSGVLFTATIEIKSALLPGNAEVMRSNGNAKMTGWLIGGEEGMEVAPSKQRGYFSRLPMPNNAAAAICEE